MVTINLALWGLGLVENRETDLSLRRMWVMPRAKAARLPSADRSTVLKISKLQRRMELGSPWYKKEAARKGGFCEKSCFVKY